MSMVGVVGVVSRGCPLVVVGAGWSVRMHTASSTGPCGGPGCA